MLRVFPCLQGSARPLDRRFLFLPVLQRHTGRTESSAPTKQDGGDAVPFIHPFPYTPQRLISVQRALVQVEQRLDAAAQHGVLRRCQAGIGGHQGLGGVPRLGKKRHIAAEIGGL